MIAEVVFWSPCLVTCVLAWVISPWYWTAFAAIVAFWSGPFTPAIPLQFGLALAIEKIYFKIRSRRQQCKSQVNVQPTVLSGDSLTNNELLEETHGKHKHTYDRPDYYD